MLYLPLLWKLLYSLPFLALAFFMYPRGWGKKTDSIVARTEERGSVVSRRHNRMKPSALRRGKVRSRAAERAVKRRSFWGRISLASRRSATGRVLSRPRVIRTTLLSLLQLIFDLPVGVLSNAQREALTACLPSHSEVCKPGEPRNAMAFRPRNWVMKKVWPTIADEANQQIRGDILRMAAQFLWKQRFSHISLAISCLFRVLEEQNIPYEVRKCALKMQTDIFFFHGIATSVENRLRAVRCWLRLIEEHRAPMPHSNDMIRLAARLISSCFVHPVHSDLHGPAVASALLAHDGTLPFLFYEISSAAASKEVVEDWWFDRLDALGFLLSDVINRTSAQQRVQMIALHNSQLVDTFHLMTVNQISYFFYHPEFRPIFTHSISLIEKLWKDVRHEKCEKGSKSGVQSSQMIVGILEDALQDGPRLQHILGLGVLAISAHFASDETDEVTDDGYAHEADVFRRVLRLHPEWVKPYKDLTLHGKDGNGCVDLGKQLGYRIRPKGVYIMEEDVDEI